MSLPGGIIADGFLLKIQNPGVLGSGPVLLKNQWSGLYGDYWSALAAIDVANRVVFDTVSSYAAGEDTKNLARQFRAKARMRSFNTPFSRAAFARCTCLCYTMPR